MRTEQEKHRDHDPISESIGNLRQPLPLARKTRLFVHNNAIKARTRSTGCGNYGEPGCGRTPDDTP
jgi:hypothetical protein